MECERCGKENYNESYYCRNCGARMDNPDQTVERTSFSIPNYLHQYQNNSQHSQQLTKANEVNADNKRYSYNNTSADNRQYSYDNTSADNRQYGYDNTSADNRQYGYDNSSADNNQYWGDNTFTDSKQSSYDNTSADDKQSSSYDNASKDSKTFGFYSTPPTSQFDYDNYNAHREPSKFDTTRVKVLKVNNVLVKVISVVAILLLLLIEAVPIFFYDMSYFKPHTSATEPVTEPEDYTAKLSYDTHIVSDSSGAYLEAEFPIPEGYIYESSGSASLALFNRNVNGTEVTLTASFFKGKLQNEIDYYSSLNGQDGKTFNMNVTDTKLGEMTLITLTRADKTTVYQVYVKSKEEHYFHISLSNVPWEYRVEADKLIDLIIEDTTVEFVKDKYNFDIEY